MGAALEPWNPGKVIEDRFELLGELGRGGTATVWLAHDRLRAEPVALKVLHAHLADQPAVGARLRREIQAAGRLRHPGALLPHDLHELEGRLVLCMPFHRGRTLAEVVGSDGPLEPHQLVRLGRRLAQVLAAAHRAGVLHRDVTPANVMVDEHGEAVLTDFGLARVEGRHTATATTVLGTPGYLAPEVHEGRPADPRADLYGLGAVLWFAASGSAPFAAPTPFGVLQRQLAGDLPSLATVRPGLPSGLVATVDALLQADPARRPASARDVDDLLAGHVPPRDAVRGRAPRRHEAPRHHLPPGPFRVVLREQGHDLPRRERRRRRLHRRDDPLSRALDHLRERVVEPAVDAMIGQERTVPAEERLAAAVSREAGLPDDALQVAPAALSPRFRLVDGVDREVADRLALAAREVGFLATLEHRGERRPRGMPPAAFVLGFVLPAFITAWVTGSLHVAGLLLGIGAILMIGTRLPGAGPRESRTPVAYGHDLRPLLRDAYKDRLPAPPQPGPSALVADEARATPAPEPPPDVPAQVLGRVRRLGELVAGADLPTAIAADLGASVRELEAEARRLAAQLADLDRALARDEGEAALEEAVQRVQARIVRLETLQRAGASVDTQELGQLREALQRHLDALARTEELLSRRVRLVAGLLELGAAANEACRDLFDATTPSHPLPEVTERLRRETRAAREARDEVERGAAQRRSLAAGRQRS